MFAGKQSNAYDDIVAKTTDENLTSENWELILNLCDKVNDEGEAGSRSVIQALLKRLAHRNPNVQLYSLALAEALSKNCGTELHREMASRSFTQGLEKLITDRMTHEKVRRRALYLISLWTGEFESNSELGLMEDLYNNLKAKNYKFEQVLEPPPPDVDDEVRRKEEEELQRVLEMSMLDKGGRNAAGYEGPSTAAGGSSSSVNHPRPGYTPVEPLRSAYPSSAIHHHHVQAAASGEPSSSPPPPAQQAARVSTSSLPEQTSPTRSLPSTTGLATRVRALHSFEPTVAGELPFEKGDIIKVTDRAYDNWWRGQLRGRTGIFPVNYVEPLPDLTAEDLAREAEQEAAVFAQATSIDKLITMLRGLDPAKDNLADNEEIQELYRSSMTLRPKIVKLIDKYSQKRAELVAMNENFVKARGVFEQMMEESLARHTGVYDTPSGYGKPRADPRTAGSFGWTPSAYEQPGYNAYPANPAAYNDYQGQHYVDPNVYGGHHQPPPSFAGMPQAPQQPYPPIDSNGYAPPPSQTSAQGPIPATQQPTQPYGHAAAPTDPQSYAQQNPQTQQQTQPQAHSQAQPQPQPQPQAQSQLDQGQGQAQVSSSQGQGQPVQTQQQGPPYVYDPNAQYADPNVQAWAQYYAQGGTDPAGAVYFISVPGVREPNQASVPDPVTGQKASVSPTASVHQQAEDPSQASQSYTSPSTQGPGQTQGIYQPSSYATPSSPVAQHGSYQHSQPLGQSQNQGGPASYTGPYSGGPGGYGPTQYGEVPPHSPTNVQ